RSHARPGSGSTLTGSSCSDSAPVAWRRRSTRRRRLPDCVRHGGLALFGVLAFVLLLVTACHAAGAGDDPGGSAGTSSASVKVVTTTTVFADIVRTIAGDRASVASIIPAGAGPEDYEPRPDDARHLADADLVISNGVGLDDFVDKLITAAGEGAPKRVVLGEGITPILVDGEPNPHF